MFGLSDVCETQRCSGTVGAYGVIDENGLPSLDGMIMRGYVVFYENHLSHFGSLWDTTALVNSLHFKINMTRLFYLYY